MEKETKRLIFESVPNQSRANELLNRLFELASPEAVFSEPVVHGEHAVITAAEVGVAMGVGFGGGSGISPEAKEPTSTEDEVSTDDNVIFGSGGGGGGSATARPVAVISIGPAGVQVEPIFDLTKIGLALFTAIGGVFIAAARMRKFAGGPGKG